jgi:hypothetical protein
MKSIQFGIAAIALAGLFGTPAQAAGKEGYLTDKAGNIVVSKTTGLCMRTKSWTPQNADPECMRKSNATKH